MRKHHRLPTPLNAEEINDRIILLQEVVDSSEGMSEKRLSRLHERIKALRRRLLQIRSPEEWCRMIYAISDDAVRVKVACIVWWDYFGGRHTEDRWPHLDALVNQGCRNLSFDKSLAAKALIKLGYSTSESTRRANVKTYLPLIKVDWRTIGEAI